MFIFIGNDQVIESKRIITILDYQLLKSTSKLKNIIKSKRQEKKVLGDNTDAKSIIITDDYLYYSPYSTITLKKREVFFSQIDQLENY